MSVLSIVLLPISLIRAHLADWPKSQNPPSPESARHPELLPRILALEKQNARCEQVLLDERGCYAVAMHATWAFTALKHLLRQTLRQNLRTSERPTPAALLPFPALAVLREPVVQLAGLATQLGVERKGEHLKDGEIGDREGNPRPGVARGEPTKEYQCVNPRQYMYNQAD